MIQYAEKNQLFFNELQIQRFNESYQRIMALKAVGPVKFHEFRLAKKY
jgi:hypothetical protein